MYCIKAVVAGIIAGLACAVGNKVGASGTDIVSDVLAAVVGFNATYFVRNTTRVVPTKP